MIPEFFEGSMETFMDDNDIRMYSSENDAKFIVAEGFVRTLKR